MLSNSTKKQRECKPYQRCGLFRQCENCNQIRQAQIADVAELASRFSKHSSYAVVMPFNQDQDTIKQLKNNIARKLRPNITGGMITVETTTNDALHLNLILNSKTPQTKEPLIKCLNNMALSGDVFLDDIQAGKHGETIATQVRKISAYSLKKQAIPTRARYNGNLVNNLGNWRSFKQVIHSKKMLRSNPRMVLAGIMDTVKRLGIVFPSITELETESQAIRDIVYLIIQLDKHDKCYSNKYGLLDYRSFKNLYNKWLVLPEKFKDVF